MEKGVFHETQAGTPQGGVISPLLANIALHGMEEALEIKHYTRGDLNSKCKRYHDRGPLATPKVSHFPQESVMLERKFERTEEKKGVCCGTSR